MPTQQNRPITVPISTSLLILLACCLGTTWAKAQSEPQQHPQTAEDVFKNVQLLRGIPVSQFLETMGFFSASLNMNCVDCHAEEAGGDWARYADDTEKKQTTRKMIRMVNDLNKANFGYPSTSIGSLSAGTITSVGPARQIQFALRLHW